MNKDDALYELGFDLAREGYKPKVSESELSDLLCVMRDLKLQPFRSGGFINKDYDMARLSIDLPIIEAKKFISKLNKYLNT